MYHVVGIGLTIDVTWAIGWGTEGATRTLSQDGQCFGQCLNRLPLEKPEASALEPVCSC
jgi:hypothetical protein